MKLDYYNFLPWTGSSSHHDVAFVTFTDETQYILWIQKYRDVGHGDRTAFVYERRSIGLYEDEKYFKVKHFLSTQRTLFATTTRQLLMQDYEEFKRNNNKRTPSLW
jgi:hypothetical protein